MELDKVIDQVKAGKKGDALVLPKVAISSDSATKGEFTNAYAWAKHGLPMRSPRPSPA
jgi:methylenetetrahydromethanopterin dehydrogenase